MVLNTLFMQSTQKTFSVALSRDMVPTARILVYCLLPDGEVLADSLSFHVAGIRNYGADVRISFGKDMSGDTVELIGNADPSTLMFFFGAEYDLYYRGLQHFFSEQKVEDEIASYDSNANVSIKHTWYTDEYRKQNQHFSAPSVAIDANTTFTFSGLVVFTDAYLTRHPSVYTCNITSGFMMCYDGGCYPINKHCDNVRDCDDGADEMACGDSDPKDNIRLPNPIRNMWMMDAHMLTSDWMWKSHFTRPDGTIQYQIPLPFWQQVWVAQGVTLSMENGLAFSEELVRIDTARGYYIEMEVPETAVKGEQIGVQVSIFNYGDVPLESLIILYASDEFRVVEVEEFGVVSSYAPRLSSGDRQTMVYLFPGETKLIHFPILPIKLGEISVSVAGYVNSGSGAWTKSIFVRMDGVTNMYHTPYYIDLVNKGSQVIPDLDIPIPEIFKHPEEFRHLYVPGSQKAVLSFVGDVVGPVYPTPNLNTLTMMDKESGSGPDFVFNFGANLYWLRFLELSHQLTPEWEQLAIRNMIDNFQSVLPFQMNNGAMSMWRVRAGPCVWLTSMTLHVFSQASDPKRNYDVFVDQEITGGMARWLAQQQNPLTGEFSETSIIHDTKIVTNVNEGASKMIITAHAVIGLSKTTHLRGEVKGMADAARGMAADYLAARLNQITDVYEICIVTYALHLAGHSSRGVAFDMMRKAKHKDKPYWSRVEIPDSREQILNNIHYLYYKPELTGEATAVQGTAYALMTYLMRNRLTEAEGIMQWLETRRNYDGAFVSSVDTLVALQALMEFALSDTNRGLYQMILNTEVTADRSWKRKLVLERGEFIRTRTVQSPKGFGAFRASVTGNGRALLQLTTEVNVEYTDQLRQPPVKAFDLTIEDYRFSGRNGSRFDMTICLRWLLTDIAPYSGYCNLMIEIPTGYHVYKRELNKLQKDNVYWNRFMTREGHVRMHIDNIQSKEKTCVSIYAIRWLPVANMSIQHLIKFYNFHEPTYRNWTIYKTYELFHNHICQVFGSYQCPYSPYYNGGLSLFPVSSVLIVMFIWAWTKILMTINI